MTIKRDVHIKNIWKKQEIDKWSKKLMNGPKNWWTKQKINKWSKKLIKEAKNR